MLKISDPLLRDSLHETAGQCVACGLCLPHCPTYRKSLNEADSPRGRIMLMSALVDGALPVNQRFFMHLDQCLACRACESVCPNSVAYGQLLNQVRAVAEPARRRSVFGRMLRWMLLDKIVAMPLGLVWTSRALRVWQAMGGRALADLVGGLGLSKLGERAKALPVIPAEVDWRSCYPAEGAQRGRVALFLGCVASVLDAETLQATIFVLTKLGYVVDVPSGQGCCGALHVGQGEMKKAAKLARANMVAFSSEAWEAVIVTASGCGAALSEYPSTIGAGGEVFAGKVLEIGEFLSGDGVWRAVEILPLHEKIAVHEPCTLRNVLHGSAALYQLLRRIPGVELAPLAGNDQCCGAGGAYRLTQPEMSGALQADKVAAMKASGSRIVVSSNIGCALHLDEGARRGGMEIEVLHPITLLARQMGFKV